MSSTTTDRPPWANRIVAHGEEPPDDLLPNPRNWRVHSAAQQGALSQVLGEVGLVQSVIVNRTTGHLIDGHLRIELAKAQGQPAVPVVYVELSDEEERIVLASLDPIGAMASVDREKLAELLSGIANPDLAELLDAVARANRIALDLGVGGLTDPDEVPEVPQEPITRPGDLWLLGPHRLLCGDSTKDEDVKLLMDGKRASLMATDPPYLVDYQGGAHPASEANQGAPGKDKHWDTYIDHEHAVEFYIAFLRAALKNALAEDAAVYECFAIMRSTLIWEAWQAVGLLAHQVAIWRKSRAVLTYSWYLWDYEPLLVGWPEGHQPRLHPPASEHAVWEIASRIEDGATGIHPTQKPVELIRRPILYHTRPGGLIFEPFSGSGTALIAAEATGRVCYAIELSPAFVDVAVRRWENFTGHQARRCEAKEGGTDG
jgi:DNA modification methylase